MYSLSRTDVADAILSFCIIRWMVEMVEVMEVV